jgi:hypothetical protein
MQTAQATRRFADAAVFDELEAPEKLQKQVRDCRNGTKNRGQELMHLAELAELLTQSPIGHPLD